ncbi:MAG: tetratricopeptide repeat protein [Gammaproteobacteria bacterium]|nr:tetratricopeptide repeat protein [Gammaproteobacteria bacterium]
MSCFPINVKRISVNLLLVCSSIVTANEIFLEGIEEPLATIASAAYEAALNSDISLSPEVAANRWGELGMLLQAHNLHEQAIAAYSNALTEISDSRWLYLRSIAYGELGYVHKSIEDLLLVTSTMRDVAIIWYRLGQALIYAGRRSDAKHALTRALALDDDLAIAHMALADVQVLNSDFMSAKASLHRAYELQPQAGQIAYRMARVERELGDLSASREWLNRRANQFAPIIEDPMLSMVAQYSTNPTFFISAARRAWERDDRETALEAYRRAIALDPKNAENLIGFTQLLTVLNRYDEATQVLDALEKVAPREGMLWYLRAVVFLEKDLVLAAQNAIEKAIAIDPTPQVVALEREIRELQSYD